MKLLKFFFVLSLLFATSSFAQSAPITESISGGTCNNPYSYTDGSKSYYCYNQIASVDGTIAGYASFYAIVQSDGTFTNSQVWLNDLNGTAVFHAYNWAGSNLSGSFSAFRNDGSPVLGTFSVIVAPYQHKEGGGRGGIRIVTSWKVISGTLVLQ